MAPPPPMVLPRCAAPPGLPRRREMMNAGAGAGDLSHTEPRSRRGSSSASSLVRTSPCGVDAKLLAPQLSQNHSAGQSKGIGDRSKGSKGEPPFSKTCIPFLRKCPAAAWPPRQERACRHGRPCRRGCPLEALPTLSPAGQAAGATARSWRRLVLKRGLLVWSRVARLRPTSQQTNFRVSSPAWRAGKAKRCGTAAVLCAGVLGAAGRLPGPSRGSVCPCDAAARHPPR